MKCSSKRVTSEAIMRNTMKQKRDEKTTPPSKKTTSPDKAAQTGRLRPSRIPKSSTSPNIQKCNFPKLFQFNISLFAVIKGSKMNISRLLSSSSSTPKSGSLIARASSSSIVSPNVKQQQQQQSKNEHNVVEMRKRKLNTSCASNEEAKKPFLMSDSRIPRIKKKDAKDEWLNTYQAWSDQDQKDVLLKLIELSHPNVVRYMREVIEPRFQRDFISLLPRELALTVLANLNPKDLMSCAQTCKTWRHLADDNLLWSRKCKQEGINGKKTSLESF